MSEVQVHYELPEGWINPRMEEIALVNYRDPAIRDLPDDLPVTFVPMAAVDAERGVIAQPEERPLKSVMKGFTSFSEGDVLFAKITPSMENGKSAIASKLLNGRGFGSTEFHVLRPYGGVLPDWLLHFVRQEGFRKEAKENFAGTAGQLRVPTDFLKDHLIPLPPFPEQRRIVAKIEELFTQLDAGISALEKSRAQLKRYRQSVLKAAVEGKLTEEWRRSHPDVEPASVLLERIEREREKSGKGRRKKLPPLDTSNLPELPVAWKWTNIQQISHLVTDGDHNPPKRVESGIPHLTAKNIINWGITEDGCTYISEESFEKVRKRYDPCCNDVIITCVGTVGRTAIVPDNYVFSADRNLAVVRLVEKGMLPKFLRFNLNTPEAQRSMASASGSTAQPHFYLNDIRAFPVSIAPYLEQLAIIEEVERRLSVADQTAATLEANLIRAARLRQSILKNAFRGELVPQDPNDEPASVLLERIKAERSQSRPTNNRGQAKRGRGRPRKNAAVQTELI